MNESEVIDSSTVGRVQKRIIDWYAGVDDVIVRTYYRTSAASILEMIDAIATRSKHGTPTSDPVTICGTAF